MDRLSHFVSIGAAVVTLGACHQAKSPEPREPQSVSAPDAKPGLSLTGGRLVLPAVKGNPAAAYFSLTNASAKPVEIAAVAVTGAGMAMIHETMQMAGHSTMGTLKSPQAQPGQTLTFMPGGKHVMVEGVPAGLKPGATIEMTITFSDGDKLSAPLTVNAPGGGG